MLNQIVFTEKDKIENLKVSDDVKLGNIHQEMRPIEKRFALNNKMQEVTLDLSNLKVISLIKAEYFGFNWETRLS